MKPSKLFFGMALLLGTMVLPASAQVSNDNEDGVYKTDSRMRSEDFVPGQVLVKFKDSSPVNVRRAKGKFQSADRNTVDAVLQQFGVEDMEKLLPNEKPGRKMRKAKAFNGTTIVEKDLSQLYLVKLSKEKVMQTRELVDELGKLSEVEFAEPNYKAYIMGEPTDETICADPSANPLYSQQWGIGAMAIDSLWNKPIVNSERPVIAIIDTGVDITHPDLVDNIWTNQREAEGEDGYDNDNNGYKNDVHGWDFINNTGNIRDFNSHGTHVAGIAAAADNGIGIIGANPRALIMPVTVMQSDGSGDIATIVKGIDYAVANGATVLNLSLGTYANSLALRQALEKAYQTAVIVAAAGNDGNWIDIECNPLPSPMFPAAYSFVLGIQATTQEGELASFSNYDCNGPVHSAYSDYLDPDGFNYELKAPGVSILSTIPNGNYKQLNGTSMAAPLVAGAISALKMVKEYDTQEILWGDLLHTNNFDEAYDLMRRPAELDLLLLQYRNRKELDDFTEEDYSDDGEIDAGETLSIYPVIRTTFGEASNIKMFLDMDEFEDPTVVEILTGAGDKVDFGFHLDAYGKGVSQNPLKVKVAEDIADNRHIKMKLVASCDDTNTIFEFPFTLVVNNMKKISGTFNTDVTLTANHVYLVNGNIGIVNGATFTIEPGTRLEFVEGMGISSDGKLVAKGTPEEPIIFTGHNGAIWGGIKSHKSKYNNPRDTISYCRLDNFKIEGTLYYPVMNDCVISTSGRQLSFFVNLIGERNNIHSLYEPNEGNYACQIEGDLKYSNIVNNVFNRLASAYSYLPKYSQLHNNNYINNIIGVYSNNYWLAYQSDLPSIDRSDYPSYLGTSREDIVKPHLFDITNVPQTYGQIDLSNMPSQPYAEAHGIVWKVAVNGYDAQDEFEQLPPLGVGRHQFEVYFNRPMNKEVAPKISFGVRDPWTQNTVAEDGSWNEEGTIYTVYKTITGKTKSDGLNRIYVYDAEDDEFFEIPYEKTRFNINIQAAGSMATGFAAEAGMGKVNLTWNNEENNFEDAMGFNIYRYTIDDAGEADTICINKEIVDVETTEYTDYDVVPGTTYYYMYKVLSTDLKEFDASNVVAVTPLTSTLGDANGSGEVDVADVITTVNYAAGQQPKPFIFEAADINTDQSIDILDVIGIIKVIMNPDEGAQTSALATATYTVEDGVVYVDCPVALAGVQVQLATEDGQTVTVADDLKGFETTSAWLTDNDYLFLGYSMSGKTLAPGKHALLNIGTGQIAKIRLSDMYGRNVEAIGSETTGIDRMGKDVMTVKGVYNMSGQKVAGSAERKNLPKGVYIINGEKVVK